MLRVVLHQGLAGLEERYQLVQEEQPLGTMGRSSPLPGVEACLVEL